MNSDFNTLYLQSELQYRQDRIRKGIPRRRRAQQLKKYAARKIG
jgi:hypothetical protein